MFPSAPANVLTAIQHLRALRDMPEAAEMPGTAAIATVALLKREAHLNMLSAELVIFHLFNTEASDESRARMARALVRHLSLWVPGEFLIDPVRYSLPLVYCSSFLPFKTCQETSLLFYRAPFS